ncbi:glycosyl hydrolase catalytic core-domain-containing protein [Microdochium trichocladiopsis]|uniref:Glycosyl hydrolase catalytic core-domain-containing protein n=1 Tax=Microdochium trichocladiopsis TaxID=1682393 RepID=A0A9P8XQL1_9PEZI|nr:glycosyl hydrolase catalytic core-domain-containing protein [Microdochium trichocladiopsis]KAH7012174.1 glycosyl hydrolase catalytic core-domain-containing protein [Microdochium trichocladiopsis]
MKSNLRAFLHVLLMLPLGAIAQSNMLQNQSHSRKRIVLWDPKNSEQIEQFPRLKTSAEEIARSPSVSGALNWHLTRPKELPADVTFYPMLRVINGTDSWQEMIEETVGCSRIIHFLNEPERAGTLVEAAVRVWRSHMLPLRQKHCYKLVGPGVASTPEGSAWLSEFMHQLETDEWPDFTGIHFYSRKDVPVATEVEAAKQFLATRQSLYNLPLIVNEMACTSRNKDDVIDLFDNFKLRRDMSASIGTIGGQIANLPAQATAVVASAGAQATSVVQDLTGNAMNATVAALSNFLHKNYTLGTRYGCVDTECSSVPIVTAIAGSSLGFALISCFTALAPQRFPLVGCVSLSFMESTSHGNHAIEHESGSGLVVSLGLSGAAFAFVVLVAQETVQSFEAMFCQVAGQEWRGRSSVKTWWLDDEYHVVDLNYTRRQGAFHVDLPDYAELDAQVKPDIKDLITLVLYGKKEDHNDIEEVEQYMPHLLTAPYRQLSLWTIYSGFYLLKRISTSYGAESP